MRPPHALTLTCLVALLFFVVGCSNLRPPTATTDDGSIGGPTQPVTATQSITTTTPMTAAVTAPAETILVPTGTPQEEATGASTATMTATGVVTVTAPITAPPAVTATTATSATGGAPGALLDATLIETVTPEQINGLLQNFNGPANWADAQYTVDVYRLTVQSTNETGAAVDLQADLYIPRVETATQFPVFAYAPGTTGLGDGCAPSLEAQLGRAWGGYRIHMLSYAGQGFIGVLPDGQSYADPARPHEYFIAELEAYTLLDAARGAYDFFAAPPAEVAAEPLPALFFGGYSNGGHTAFAAKDFAASYAPELPLLGVISHGATTNVETLMRESPLFTPYLVYTYRFFYGAEVITPAQVFTQDWLPTFDADVTTKCVDEIFVYYSNDPQAMYTPAFRRALENGRLAEELPLFKTVVDANYAGTFGGFEIPVVFFQGTADSTVTPIAQQAFAADLCAQGESVTYVPLPAVRHVTTRQDSFLATIEWMRTIIDGGAPPNDCADLTTAE